MCGALYRSPDIACVFTRQLFKRYHDKQVHDCSEVRIYLRANLSCRSAELPGTSVERRPMGPYGGASPCSKLAGRSCMEVKHVLVRQLLLMFGLS